MVAAILTGVLVACTKEGDTIYLPDPNEETASTRPLVTVIYDANALGDQSYNDLIYQGVERTALELNLRTLQQSPRTYDEGVQLLELLFCQLEAARDSVRRLVIVASPCYDEFIRKNNKRLEANPFADLLYLETPTPLEGKGATLYMPYYGAMYEAGRIDAATENPSVMLLGANRLTPAVTDAMQGYRDGFETGLQLLTDRQKRRARLGIAYLDETGEAGFSVADTTALRLLRQWDAEGYMSLIPVCGGAFNTFSRMNNFVLLNLVGIDCFFDSYSSYCSVVKRVGEAMDRCIRQWLSDEGMPKHQSLGLAQGYTDVIISGEIPIWIPQGYEGSTVPVMTEEMIQEMKEEAIRREAEHEK